MTNPAMPNPTPMPPKSGGGMPTWLILVLVGGLVVVLGCCGGVTMCIWGARRAARRVQEIRAVQAGLPADVPVMAGFTASGINVSDAAKGTGMAMLSGKASRADVVAYYEKQMKVTGWSELSSQAVGPSSTMVFAKDARQSTIQATEMGGTTLLTIQYGPKP